MGHWCWQVAAALAAASQDLQHAFQTATGHGVHAMHNHVSSHGTEELLTLRVLWMKNHVQQQDLHFQLSPEAGQMYSPIDESRASLCSIW